jgi:hypothetical protein
MASREAKAHCPLYAWPKPGNKNDSRAAAADRGSARRGMRDRITILHGVSGRAAQYRRLSVVAQTRVLSVWLRRVLD